MKKHKVITVVAALSVASILTACAPKAVPEPEPVTDRPEVHNTVKVVTPVETGTAHYVTAPRHVIAIKDPTPTPVQNKEEIPLPKSDIEPESTNTAPANDTVAVPILLPEPPIPTPVPEPVITEVEKVKVKSNVGTAWDRYCDNGQGMTPNDEAIIEEMNYVIPERLEGDCLPPK